MGATCSSERCPKASVDNDSSLRTLTEDATLLEMGFDERVSRLYEVVDVFADEHGVTLCKVKRKDVLASEKGIAPITLIAKSSPKALARLRKRTRPTSGYFQLKQIIVDNPVLLLRWHHTIDLFRALDHPNLPRLMDVHNDDDHCHESCVSFVMEICEGGHLLERSSSYTEPIARKILRQVLEVVEYLHASNIIHGDLRPHWFMFESSDPKLWRIKLMDFSMARQEQRCPEQGDTSASVPRVLHGHEACMYSAAPEILLNGRLHTKSGDMWSVGVILYQLLAGKPPFGDNRDEFMENMRLGNVPPTFQEPEWNRISSSAKELIQKLLNPQPRARPTATQALRHCWVSPLYRPLSFSVQ
jgi:serine/threonine protein kinase